MRKDSNMINKDKALIKKQPVYFGQLAYFSIIHQRPASKVCKERRKVFEDIVDDMLQQPANNDLN